MDYVDTFLKQKKEYVEKRGSELGKNFKAVAKTSYFDILSLLNWWNKEWIKATGGMPKGTGEGTTKRFWELKERIESDSEKIEDKSVEYSKNEEIWGEILKFAIHMNSYSVVPSHWEMASDAVKEAIKDITPDIPSVPDIKKTIIIAGSLIGGLIALKWILK